MKYNNLELHRYGDCPLIISLEHNIQELKVMALDTLEYDPKPYLVPSKNKPPKNKPYYRRDRW